MALPDNTTLAMGSFPGMTDGLPAAVTSAARTDVGKRRTLNEDSYLDRRDMALWMVADGVGGWNRGDFASRSITDRADLLRLPERGQDALSATLSCLQEVNSWLFALGTERGGQRMASTVVTLLIRGGLYHCLWAGDSRCYLYRNAQLMRATRDHSKVQELVSAGLITPQEAERHPDGNIITRAIGVRPEMEVEIASAPLMDLDRFLLCSDGLTNHVNDREIEALMREDLGQSLVDRLIQLALARGGTDNITVLTVDVMAL